MDLWHISMLLCGVGEARPRSWLLYSMPGGCILLPLPITITGTPEHLITTTIEHIINKWAFVCKVSELCWVTLDSTDKIKGLLELTSHDKSPFGLDKKEINYPFNIQGFKLQLLCCSLCLVCGDDDHVQMDCPIKQKLVAASVKGWAYLGRVEEPVAPETEMVAGPSNGAVDEGPTAVDTGVAVGLGGEKVKAKKKGLRKRKGDDVGLVAKKARN